MSSWTSFISVNVNELDGLCNEFFLGWNNHAEGCEVRFLTLMFVASKQENIHS